MAIRFGVAKRRKRRTRRNARRARRVYRMRRRNPRRRSRRNPANFRFGRHRPVLIRGRKGWRRPAHSKYFKRPTRINPRYRRRKSYRRHNPKINLKGIFSQRWLMQVAKVGGGAVLGFLTIPLVNGMIPEKNRPDYDKYLGLVNVLIGGLMFGFLKNKDLKDMGIIVAGMGVYDLIAKNVEQLKLMAIPRTNAMITDLLPEAEPSTTPPTPPKTGGTSGSYQVPYLPVSRAAAAGMVGASYPGARAGYLGDSYRASQGFGDNPYEGIEW